MKLIAFISRLKELNAYLGEVPPNTPGQQIAPFPTDDTMDVIYYSMSTTWKK